MAAAGNESEQEENGEVTCVTRKLMRPAFEGRTGKQVSDAFQAWRLSYSLPKRNCLKAATHPVWAHKPVSVLSFRLVGRSVLVKVIY